MAHDVVIFNTQLEAETQQGLDLAAHLLAHTGAAYQAGTTRWDTPKLRLDGKWDYRTCDHQDYTGMTTQAHNNDDYAIEEE